MLWTQLFILRTGWFWYLVMMSIQPLTLFVFIRFLIGTSNHIAIIYLISGNIVMGLSLSSMLSLGQDLGWLKHSHAFDYYATLPISKLSLILAITTRSSLIAFPSIIITLVISIFAFHLSLSPNILILPAVLISSYALSGIGAIIGFYSPNGRISNLLTQIIQPVIIFLSPVFVPIEQLPKMLQITSKFIPTTYVAQIIRDSLFNAISRTTWYSFFIVLVIVIISFIFIETGLDWRNERR